MQLFEQETSILYNREDPNAGIITFDPVMRRKLLKIAAQRNELHILQQDEERLSCEVPRSWVKITPSRILSEETRKQMASNFGKNSSQHDV